MTVDDHREGVVDRPVPVCRPRSPTELAVVLGLLESEGIGYHVSNDYFGSLHVGPAIPLFNEKIVLVAESDFEVASALVTPIAADDDGVEERGFTFFEKLRMAIEVFVFGWIIPWRGGGREHVDD